LEPGQFDKAPSARAAIFSTSSSGFPGSGSALPYGTMELRQFLAYLTNGHKEPGGGSFGGRRSRRIGSGRKG